MLTRYPDGIDGKSFFQKDAPVYAPSWLRLETMWSEHAEREIRYFVLDDVESLLYVANMGTIPLHVWSSRVAALERPDWCILDLDPKGAPFKHVVEIARHMHALCEDVGLTQLRQDERLDGLARADPARRALHLRAIAHARRAARALHGEVAARDRDDRARPSRTATARSISTICRTATGDLLVSPFCVRPLPGAPVSMPIEWPQINGRLKLERFNDPLGAQVAARRTAIRSPPCSRSRRTCWPRSRR